MNAQILRIARGGATLEITEEEIFRNFCEVTQRGPVELPILRRSDIPRIGEYWKGQGGALSGFMKGVNGNPDYFLITPIGDAGYIEKIKFGGYGEEIEGPNCEFDGLANTNALCESKRDYPAAQWAREQKIEGHTDWYLAARREERNRFANTSELFAPIWHFTSTQYSANAAWSQHFVGGYQSYNDKSTECAVRVVRRVVVPF